VSNESASFFYEDMCYEDTFLVLGFIFIFIFGARDNGITIPFSSHRSG